MSEFTDGILILNEHRTAAEKAVTKLKKTSDPQSQQPMIYNLARLVGSKQPEH